MIDSTRIPELKKNFTMRPATMADVVTAVTLFNIRSRHDTGRDDATAAEIESEWQSPGFDPSTDIRLVFNENDELVGYIEVWAVAAPPIHPWLWGCVHPQYERQGIGTAMMHWAINRAHDHIDRVPPEARVSLMASTLTKNEGAHRLYRRLGMTEIRHFWRMAIALDKPIPAPEWPAGITLQSGDVYGETMLVDVFHAVRDAFQDHWGHVESDENEALARWQHRHESDPEFDPSLWFVALDGKEIAGFSICRHHVHDNSDMGWVNVLGVRRPWRRQGLAMALLLHSFRALQARGQPLAGLDVDASSLTNATVLYQKAGMHVERQHDTYELEIRAGVELAKRG